MVAFVIAVALVTLLYFAVTKNKKTFALAVAIFAAIVVMDLLPNHNDFERKEYTWALEQKNGYSTTYIEGVVKEETVMLDTEEGKRCFYIIETEEYGNLSVKRKFDGTEDKKKGDSCVLLIAKRPSGEIFFTAIEKNEEGVAALINPPPASEVQIEEEKPAACPKQEQFCGRCKRMFERRMEREERFCKYCGSPIYR